MYRIRKELEFYHQYLGLLLKCKSSEDVMNLYVEYLKRTVEFGTNSPCFERHPLNYKYGNCYTYALGLKCPPAFYYMYSLFNRRALNFDVGFISATSDKSNIKNSNKTELLERLYNDCDALRIRVYNSKLNKSPEHGGYKVFLFASYNIKNNHDFHLVRRNINGTLSHKRGYNGKITSITSLDDVSKNYKLVRTLEIVKPVIR